jgi:hypothetical protein
MVKKIAEGQIIDYQINEMKKNVIILQPLNYQNPDYGKL